MEFSAFSDPDLIKIAHARGEFRLAQATIVEPVESHEIMGYDECNAAYLGLRATHRIAQQSLFDSMQVDPRVVDSSGQKPQRVTAWFSGHRVLRDGQRALVSYEVGANIVHGQLAYSNKDYDCQNTHRSAALWISTRTIHNPTSPIGRGIAVFTGRLQGHVAFDSDVTHVVVDEDQVKLRSASKIEANVRTALETESRHAVLGGWLGPLVEMSQWSKQTGKDLASLKDKDVVLGLTNFQDAAISLRKLLYTESQEPEELLNVLDSALIGANFDIIHTILSRPMDEVKRVSASYPLLGRRLNWLMANAAAMRLEIETAQRKRLMFDYKDSYLVKLQEEYAKVAFIETLVRSLSENTQNINDCRPVTPTSGASSS